MKRQCQKNYFTSGTTATVACCVMWGRNRDERLNKQKDSYDVLYVRNDKKVTLQRSSTL